MPTNTEVDLRDRLAKAEADLAAARVELEVAKQAAEMAMADVTFPCRHTRSRGNERKPR